MNEHATVPDAVNMDDHTFLRHLDARHTFDIADETPLADYPHPHQAWIKPYRSFHEYLHRTQEYQHDHAT